MDDTPATRLEARAASNRLYGRVAAVYSAWVRVGSLGAFPKLYRTGCQSLALKRGQVVLDVCCGTGELFPYLYDGVGPEGSIVGCDLSAAMLRRARRRIHHGGWHNISLFECDAQEFVPPQAPDAAIFSICLSAIPWRLNVFDHVISMLEPGARVVVIDSLSVGGQWWNGLSNAYNRTKGRIIGADPDCGLRDAIAARLESFQEDQVAGGVYSLLIGRVPVRAGATHITGSKRPGADSAIANC